MSKEKRNYLIGVLVISVITILTLYFTLKDDNGSIMALLQSISPIAAIGILLYALLPIMCMGASLTAITKTYYPKFRYAQGLVNAFIGALFSGITPGASGGQVGQIFVYSKQGVPFASASSALWMDFIIYQITLIGYTVVFMILRFPMYYAKYPFLLSLILIGFLINGSVVVALWSMARFPALYEKISYWITHFLHTIHLVKNEEATLQAWNAQLQAFTREINASKDNKNLVFKLVIINILRLTAYFSIPYVIGLAMHQHMPLIDSIALSCFVSMANAFFPIPGASGGTEVMFHTLYSMLLQSALVSSIMLCWRFTTYHLILVIGMIMFIFVRKMKS